MKTNKIIIAGSLFAMGIFVTSCTSGSTENSTNAEQKLNDDREAFDQKARDKEMEGFIRIYEAQLIENEENLSDFNIRIAIQKKEAKDNYELKIAELNAKNSDMKKKIADFNAGGKKNWETFKVEFDNEMTELKESFNAFTLMLGFENEKDE